MGMPSVPILIGSITVLSILSYYTLQNNHPYTNNDSISKDLLSSIPAVVWASMGIASSAGLSITGAAIGMFMTGNSLMGAAIKAPTIRTRHLIT